MQRSVTSSSSDSHGSCIKLHRPIISLNSGWPPVVTCYSFSAPRARSDTCSQGNFDSARASPGASARAQPQLAIRSARAQRWFKWRHLMLSSPFPRLLYLPSGRMEREDQQGERKKSICEGVVSCTFLTFSSLPHLSSSPARPLPPLTRGAVQDHNYRACHYRHNYCLSELRERVVCLSVVRAWTKFGLVLSEHLVSVEYF